MTNILINRAKCAECGDVVESTHRHDFRWCKCGAIAVDGGKEYLKRVGNPANIIDLSLFDEEDPSKWVDMGQMEFPFQDSAGEGADTTMDGTKDW